MEVMNFLRGEGEKIESFYAYLDCHGTPGFYSATHRNASYDFPDCSPIGYRDTNITEHHLL